MMRALHALGRVGVVVGVFAVLVGACGEAPPPTVSEQSEMWLDRFEIDLSGPNTAEARGYLSEACDEAEDWHKTRADREEANNEFDAANVYLEDWIVLAGICNQALFDDEWEEAGRRLDKVRP